MDDPIAELGAGRIGHESSLSQLGGSLLATLLAWPLLDLADERIPAIDTPSRHHVAMEESAEIGSCGVTVTFACARRLPNGAAELLDVTIRDVDLEAGKSVYEGYSDGFEQLACFFEDLAASSRGRRAIGALSQQVEALSLGLTSPVRVNVVFHVEGRLAPNEFVGVRAGRFNKGKSLLVVQAAVPAGQADERRAVLLRLLANAIDEAEAFARKRGIADDLGEIRALIESLPAE